MDDFFYDRDYIENEVDWGKLGVCVTGSFESAEDALKSLPDGKPDVVMTDIEMPGGMNGIAFAALIKKQYPHIEIILISCYQEFRYARDALRIDVSDYITKPASVEEMEEAVSGVIEKIYRLRGADAQTREVEQPLKRQDKVDIIKKYIEDNYQQPLTCKTIADHMFFSPNYINTVFYKKVGVSIPDYIERVRVEQAKKILSTTECKLYEVIELVGYHHLPHFNKVFEKHTGQTLREFRDSFK